MNDLEPRITLTRKGKQVLIIVQTGRPPNEVLWDYTASQPLTAQDKNEINGLMVTAGVEPKYVYQALRR